MFSCFLNSENGAFPLIRQLLLLLFNYHTHLPTPDNSFLNINQGIHKPFKDSQSRKWPNVKMEPTRDQHGFPGLQEGKGLTATLRSLPTGVIANCSSSTSLCPQPTSALLSLIRGLQHLPVPRSQVTWCCKSLIPFPTCSINRFTPPSQTELMWQEFYQVKPVTLSLRWVFQP